MNKNQQKEDDIQTILLAHHEKQLDKNTPNKSGDEINKPLQEKISDNEYEVKSADLHNFVRKNVNKSTFPSTKTEKTENSADNSNFIHKLRKKEAVINLTNKIYHDFGDKLLLEFNIARTTPREYAKKLKDLRKHIRPLIASKFKKENKEDEGLPENYFKKDIEYIFHIPSVIKVHMPGGKETFNSVINMLKDRHPVSPLKWNDEIMIDIPGNSIEFSKEIVQKLILKKKSQVIGKYPLFYVHFDIISDPIISAALQIVDDTAFKGNRREAILNSKYSFFSVAQGLDKNKKLFSFISLA
jgi:hypothetical protein